jgi:glycosyltransferase involved in cell wall biosynthesis
MKKTGEIGTIAVISTVHYTYDNRIFYKQIKSLESYYHVLYFSPTKESHLHTNVIPLYKSSKKIGRIVTHLNLLLKLPFYKADLYLLHDPELMLLGLFLKAMKKVVVWDMHEDTYSDIHTKSYLNKYSRTILSFVYRWVQSLCFRVFDGFVLAEDEYGEYFGGLGEICVVHNYPILGNIGRLNGVKKESESLVYIGSITRNRGISRLLEMILEIKKTLPNIKLVLIGPFDEQGLEEDVRTFILRNRIERNVMILGPMKNIEALPVLASCMIGLALLLPEPNFTKSLPTKVFEYMALGLPVLVSDFPLWKQMVMKHDVGLVVDPMDVPSAARMVVDMITNKKLYIRLANNAQQAFRLYSWETESLALCNFIKKLLGKELPA